MRMRIAVLCALLALLAISPALCEEACSTARQVTQDYACMRADGAPADDAWFEDALLIGDSIADSLLNYDVLPALEIQAYIGQSPRGALENKLKLEGKYQTMAELAQGKNPAKLIIMLGSNGLDTAGPEKVLKDYHRLLDALLGTLPQSEFYLMSVLPVRESVKERWHELTAENIRTCNEGLLALAQEHGVYYVDAYSALLGEDGRTIASGLCTGDGIHLNRTGAQIAADAIRAQVGR